MANPPKSHPPPRTPSSTLKPSWGVPRQSNFPAQPIPKARPAPPPPPPPPLRPTQMPYAQLKKDPRFRSLSRKWTGLIVAIPFLGWTTWELYARHTGRAAQKRLTIPAPPPDSKTEGDTKVEEVKVQSVNVAP